MTKNEKQNYKELLEKEQKRKEQTRAKNLKYRDYYYSYGKKTYTQVSFKLNTVKDADLIEFLKSQRNRTQVLREAIEKYRKGH